MLFNKIKISLIPIGILLSCNCMAMESNNNKTNIQNIDKLNENFNNSLKYSNEYLNNLQNINDKIIETLKENTINTYKNLWNLQYTNNDISSVSVDEWNFKKYLENVNNILLKNNIDLSNNSLNNILYKYIIDDEINISTNRNSKFHLKYFYMHHLNISNIFELQSTLDDISNNDKDNMKWFSNHIKFRMKNSQYTPDISFPVKKSKNNTQENRLLNLIANNTKITRSCIKELKDEYSYNYLINCLTELKYNSNSKDEKYGYYENMLYNDRENLIDILTNIRNIKYPPAPVEPYIPNKEEEQPKSEEKIPLNQKKYHTFQDALKVYKPIAFKLLDILPYFNPGINMSVQNFDFCKLLAKNVISEKANSETQSMLKALRPADTTASDFEDSKHVLYTALKMIKDNRFVYDQMTHVLDSAYNKLSHKDDDIELRYSSISDIIDLAINTVKLNELSKNTNNKYEKINEKEYKNYLQQLQGIFNTVANLKTEDLFKNIQKTLDNSIDILKNIYKSINNGDLKTDDNLFFLRQLGSNLYIKYTNNELNNDNILLYKACVLALYCQKLVCDVYFKKYPVSPMYQMVYDLCYKYLENIHQQFIKDLNQYFK